MNLLSLAASIGVPIGVELMNLRAHGTAFVVQHRTCPEHELVNVGEALYLRTLASFTVSESVMSTMRHAALAHYSGQFGVKSRGTTTTR